VFRGAILFSLYLGHRFVTARFHPWSVLDWNEKSIAMYKVLGAEFISNGRQ
jgi:hypothetical protein